MCRQLWTAKFGEARCDIITAFGGKEPLGLLELDLGDANRDGLFEECGMSGGDFKLGLLDFQGSRRADIAEGLQVLEPLLPTGEDFGSEGGLLEASFDLPHREADFAGDLMLASFQKLRKLGASDFEVTRGGVTLEELMQHSK